MAARADLVLFIVDGDLTDTETQALRAIADQHRPILLILNKVDHYTAAERETLLASLRRHSAGLVDPANLVTAAADPAPQLLIRVDAEGNEEVSERRLSPDVSRVRERLWEILQAEGKTLAALNASLFAGRLSDQVGERVLAARQALGQRVIRSYCIGKGVAVAFNPVPVADLLAAAMVDVSMLVHLSKLYGLPLSRREAGGLIKTIGAQWSPAAPRGRWHTTAPTWWVRWVSAIWPKASPGGRAGPSSWYGRSSTTWTGTPSWSRPNGRSVRNSAWPPPRCEFVRRRAWD